MKAKQTRIELLSELGPFKAGSLINISPMVAANLIRQGKAKVSKDELQMVKSKSKPRKKK